MTRLPTQHKKRLIVLEEFARKFHPGRVYDEHEVDAIIAEQFDDYCTVRRELVEEGYLAADGTTVPGCQAPIQVYGTIGPGQPEEITKQNSETMKTRAEIKREYKETPKQAGVFKIQNKINGKVPLGKQPEPAWSAQPVQVRAPDRRARAQGPSAGLETVRAGQLPV